MIGITLAKQLAQRAGMFAMLLPPGSHLCFYRGNQSAPRKSWTYIGSTMVSRVDNEPFVSRHAVEHIAETQ